MKVVRDNKMARLIGNDQIPADPLETARKQKMGIENREGFRILPMCGPAEVHMTGRTLVGPTSPKITSVLHNNTQKMSKILSIFFGVSHLQQRRNSDSAVSCCLPTTDIALPPSGRPFAAKEITRFKITGNKSCNRRSIVYSALN